MRYFRLTTKQDKELVLELLREEGFEVKPGFTFPIFKCVREPFALGSSLAATLGLIYLQDKASFLPAFALNPQPKEIVLDLCASPGSKTGLLAFLVGREGLVVANEPNKNRLITLRQNLLRCNQINVISTSYAGESFPKVKFFKYILLDVPCSGWGTEEKNRQVKKIWQANKIKPLLNLQQKLLKRAAELLAPGGFLLYSTCTTNEQENEEQISWAVENLGLKLKKINFPFEIKGLKAGQLPLTLRLDMIYGEQQGFFLALLQKEKTDFAEKEVIKKSKLEAIELNEFKIKGKGKLFLFADKVYFIPERAQEFLGNLKFKGFWVGKLKDNKFKPYSRLRLVEAKTEAKLVFEQVDKLKRFLQGESFSFSGQGYYPFYYKELFLGWARAQAGRIFWSS